MDPARIYLGGHSTGGTLVLLVAASTDRFRRVLLRTPRRCPSLPAGVRPVRPHERPGSGAPHPGALVALDPDSTFVFEGSEQGNLDALSELGRRSKNPSFISKPSRARTISPCSPP